MDLKEIREEYGCLLIGILIGVIIGGNYIYRSSLINETQHEKEIKEIIEKKIKDDQDSINKQQFQKLLLKYNAIEKIPKEVEYSFQLQEYLIGKIIVRKLNIADIIKRDSIHYLYSSINKGFIYKLKINKSQIQELLKIEIPFNAIIKVEKVSLYTDILYDTDGSYIDFSLANKNKVIEGILIDYLIEKNRIPE